MRKDQPELKKQFKQFKELLKYAATQMKEHVSQINQLNEANKDLEQELLISRIEHDRLLHGKPPLTLGYLVKNIIAIFDRSC
jgi:hypothetical protein